ncbi:uncharacterized protein LOC113765589 [Coffea eugenioides]|uniref:uncharacterized protein LOC113765589 n=1 Tax=Coffea eugenioides TaxID=49369 RepID=UPI000F61367E|nr:uncharacterized protein LOC113765589 [Coffea eugenioides]XP_027165619.1 uncharacterized protein LOC113765589 [Coffea eugenioides]XP_027165620.1 uncharacterized protein LOC113765589 [Coffea eugenioides]
MKTDVSKAGHDCRPLKRKSEVLTSPVPPGASGKGLPYAPVDWPNVGDIWGWRVGTRVRVAGFYNDRFLYAPQRLQKKPTRKLLFQSKPSVLRYLKSQFPEADIEEFFASFTWDVPAEAHSSKLSKCSPSPQSRPLKKESGKLVKVVEVSNKKQKAAVKKPSQKSARRCGKELMVDVPAVEEQTLASGPTTKISGRSQVSDSHAIVSPHDSACHSPIDLKPQGLKSLDESQPGLIPEDFDYFLNSLDEILFLPITRAEISDPAASSHKEGMTQIRSKLSSLLAMGFASLADSNKLTELIALASKLKNDPTLSPREISMLKLIEEIPMASNIFLEAKKLPGQAEKFFADLDANMATVASLRNEYSVAKQQLEIYQADEASALLTLMEIDEQIAALQSRRAEITQNVKLTNKKIVQYSSSQKKVMECLPKIVHDVQVANSEKQEWELRKKRSAEQEAEILAKFAPLDGFSF